ncbi:hypothetical protein ABIA39_001100 [Nocardia sp. GAS34]|uniref:hypothetical protein n=1 Tax=unclassified Nocardia TaxID=2637762 RepID=UPI003D1DF744
MNEHSDDSAPPMLARDGVTIVRWVGGVTDDGIAFDGFEEFEPGDPGYDELLPLARENPLLDEEPENPIDPDMLARVLRDAGMDVPESTEDG